MANRKARIATAYVQVIPSLDGYSSSIQKQLNNTRMRNTFESSGNNMGSLFGRSIQRSVNRAMYTVQNTINRTMATAGLLAGAAIGATLTGGINRALNIEDAGKRIQGLGYSAAQLETILKNAQNAVLGTQFSLDEALRVGASGLAAGIKPGEDIEKYLRLIADTATIAGSSMREVGLVFNQVTANGRLYAEEANQFTDRGIPIYAWLSERFGTTGPETRALIRAGKVSAEMVMEVFQANLGGAAEMSTKTARGAFRNWINSLNRMTASLVQESLPMLQAGFMRLYELSDTISEIVTPRANTFWEELSPKFVAGVDKFADSIEMMLTDEAYFNETWIGKLVANVESAWKQIERFSDMVKQVQQGTFILDKSDFMSIFVDFGAKLVDEFKLIFGYIQANSGKISTALSVVATGLFDGILKIVDFIEYLVKDLVPSLASELALVKPLIDGFVDATRFWYETLYNSLKFITTLVNGLAQGLGLIDETNGKLVTTEQLLYGIGTLMATGLFVNLLGNVRGLVGGILTFFTGGLSTKIGSKIGGGVIGGLKNAFSDKSITNAFSKMSDVLFNIGAGRFTKLKDLFGKSASAVLGASPFFKWEASQKLLPKINPFVNFDEQQVDTAWEKLSRRLQNKADRSQAFKSFFEKLKNGFSSIGSNFKMPSTQPIKDFFTKVSGWSKTTFTNMFSGAKTAFTNFQQLAISSGSMFRTYKPGIDISSLPQPSTFQKLKTAMSNFFTTATTKTKLWTVAIWANTTAMLKNAAVATGTMLKSLWLGTVALAKQGAAWIAATAAMIANKVAQAAAAVASGVLTAAQWALNVAMLANPIGLVIAAVVAAIAVIAALVAGIVWLVNETTFFQDVWAGIVGFFEDSVKNIGSFFTDFVRNIQNFFRGIGNFFIGIINFVIDGINGLGKIMNEIIKQTGFNEFLKQTIGIEMLVPTIPNIPMLAKGGNVMGPTLAMIGEGGRPETVTDLGMTNKMIADTTRLVNTVANTSGAPVVENFEVNITVDNEQRARDVLRMIELEKRKIRRRSGR